MTRPRSRGMAGSPPRRPKSPYAAGGDLSLNSFEVRAHIQTVCRWANLVWRSAYGRPQRSSAAAYHPSEPHTPPGALCLTVPAQPTRAQSSFDSFNDERRRKLRDRPAFAVSLAARGVAGDRRNPTVRNRAQSAPNLAPNRSDLPSNLDLELGLNCLQTADAQDCLGKKGSRGRSSFPHYVNLKAIWSLRQRCA